MTTSAGMRSVFLMRLLVLICSANATEYMTQNCFKTIKAGNSSGILASQAEDYYGENIDCTVTISASTGRGIRLSFFQLDIQGGSLGYCRGDYLRVYDGPSSYSQQIGVDICGVSSLGDITSKSNYITLRFWTDSFGSGRGVLIEYATFKDDRSTGSPNSSFSQMDAWEVIAITSGAIIVLIITLIVVVRIKRSSKRANPHTSPLQLTPSIPPPPYTLPYEPASTTVPSPIQPVNDAQSPPWSPVPYPLLHLLPHYNEPPPAYTESAENQCERVPII